MRRIRFQTSTAASILALGLAAAPLVGQQPVEVTVRSPESKPVAGATVELASEVSEYSGSATSDANGVARFDVPGVGATYRMAVLHDGFARYQTTFEVPKPRRSRIRTVEVGVTLAAKSAPERFNRAVEALRSGDYEEAEAYLREATELDPELARAWGILALIAVRAERWQDAADASGRAIALEPGDVETLRARHEALSRLGRTDEAEATLDALCEHDPAPELARRLFNSGAERANHGDSALARRRFGQALERDPKLWQAHSGLAEVSISEKDFDGALAELDAALAIAPGQKKLERRRVEVLRAAGRTEEADAAAAALGE